MNDSKSRPKGLPEFRKPPLNEVVLGVQFSQVEGYQQILAGKVWELFKKDFPTVAEMEALPPSFETFPAPNLPMGQAFRIGSGPEHNRFWFLSNSEDELIQFQHDRLLHNWRKVGDQTNEYPRYEHIIRQFEDEMNNLAEFFETLGENKASSTDLSVTQCEISYVNHIVASKKGQGACAGDWLRFLSFVDGEPEGFSAIFRETFSKSENEPPIGRLTCDISKSVDVKGEPIIAMKLIFRGAPETQSIKSAIKFLNIGREVIVRKFDILTTEYAHKQWKKLSS